MNSNKIKEVCLRCRTYTGKKEHSSYKCYTSKCPVWKPTKRYNKKIKKSCF